MRRVQTTSWQWGPEGILFCPHLPDAGCDCRKPLPGLLQQLGEHYGVGLEGVPLIGDSLRDLEAAVAVGASPLLVRTGNGAQCVSERDDLPSNLSVYEDLSSFADELLAA